VIVTFLDGALLPQALRARTRMTYVPGVTPSAVSVVATPSVSWPARFFPSAPHQGSMT
jgi:hypothetical protein